MNVYEIALILIILIFLFVSINIEIKKNRYERIYEAITDKLIEDDTDVNQAIKLMLMLKIQSYGESKRLRKQCYKPALDAFNDYIDFMSEKCN